MVFNFNCNRSFRFILIKIRNKKIWVQLDLNGVIWFVTITDKDPSVDFRLKNEIKKFGSLLMLKVLIDLKVKLLKIN